MSNCVDSDETAHDEPSHLDLCCFQKPITMPVAVKELNTRTSRFIDMVTLKFDQVYSVSISYWRISTHSRH